MKAYDKAISLLSMREHTEKEIREKLLKRGFSPSDIDEAVKRIKEEGSLSEERFAESYIRTRLEKNPEGSKVLLIRLRQKGTPNDIAEMKVKEAWDRGDYKKGVRKVILKMGADKAGIFLMKKGFSRYEIENSLEEE